MVALMLFLGLVQGLTMASEPVNPMEQLASPAAMRARLQPLGPMVLVTEPREMSIRRFDAVPTQWLTRPTASLGQFTGTARPGETYPFQIGVVATTTALPPLKFHGSALDGPAGQIPADHISCLKLQGIGPDGEPIHPIVSVTAGHVQPLWILINVPNNAHGRYAGKVTVSAGKMMATSTITLNVTGAVVPDGGVDDPARLSRLRWLNSTIGDGHSVTRPFVPIQSHGSTFTVLGRDLAIDNNGLPSHIVSHFSASNTHILKQGRDVLAKPCQFIITIGGQPVSFSSHLSPVAAAGDIVDWAAKNSSPQVDANVTGQLDFTGSCKLDIAVSVPRNINVDDIAFDLPMPSSVARYWMGLGKKGGLRKGDLHWTWNPTNSRMNCGWAMTTPGSCADLRAAIIAARWRMFTIPLAPWSNRIHGIAPGMARSM